MRLMLRLKIFLMKKLVLRLCAKEISALIRSQKKTQLIGRQLRTKQPCWLNRRPFYRQSLRQLKKPRWRNKRE
jgi:hypothetical protein